LLASGRILLGVAIAGFWTVVTPVGPKLVGAQAGTRAISFIVTGVSAGTVIGLPAGQAGQSARLAADLRDRRGYGTAHRRRAGGAPAGYRGGRA
jgi:hypothetical protein